MSQGPSQEPSFRNRRRNRHRGSGSGRSTSVHLFGIRHHGPGSARSLQQALDALAPDCVLIEGPPDADAHDPPDRRGQGHGRLLWPCSFIRRTSRNRRRSTPYAVFSPEWVAMRHALGGTACRSRFMDLPQALQLAPEPASDAPPEDRAARSGPMPQKPNPWRPNPRKPNPRKPNSQCPCPPKPRFPKRPTFKRPPLSRRRLGKRRRTPPQRSQRPSPSCASDPHGRTGAKPPAYADADQWWDELVESRASRGLTTCSHAVAEAMEARARGHAQTPDIDAVREERREACDADHHPPAAAKDGFHARIAVVCGAWHVPALARYDARGQAKLDAATLKGPAARSNGGRQPGRPGPTSAWPPAAATAPGCCPRNGMTWSGTADDAQRVRPAG